MSFKCAIFDLDGVVTEKDSVNALAWERMFNVFSERSCLCSKLQLFNRNLGVLEC